MTRCTVSVDETFWSLPGLGFQVMEPMFRSRIARLKERTEKLLGRSDSTVTHLRLPSVQKDETVILFSETILLELERKGIAFSLSEYFVRGQEGERRFYYYAVPNTMVRASSYLLDGSVSMEDEFAAIDLSRFEAPAANLLNLMMSEPAEPGVTPELRMKELVALVRNIRGERFSKKGFFVLKAALATLCGLDIDAAFRTEWYAASITEVINKNGWVKQF